MKILDKLKLLRLVRVITNLKHLSYLRRNSSLYKKLGIHKKVWQAVSYQAIKNHDTTEAPWLDGTITVDEIRHRAGYSCLPDRVQAQILQWPKNGFLILPSFFTHKTIDDLEQSIEKGLSEKLRQKYISNRVVNLYQSNQLINGVFRDPVLLNILSFILGKEIIPFQTINFYKSSSQPAHSDAIHLTTEPLGYSLGVWVALEDVEKGSGEFFYYPGSHQFNYVMNSDFTSGKSSLKLGNDLHHKYEEKIAELINEKCLKANTFLPKKGDIFIWHTNLLHGSLPKQKN